MDPAMADQIDALFSRLTAPFREDQVRWRKAGGGRQLPYLSARDVMDRLDAELGPQNWWADFTPGDQVVVCRLTVRLPDGSTLTKSDAGGYPHMSEKLRDGSEIEDVKSSRKGGFSDAFKRAAVMFGIGRHLGAAPAQARPQQARDQRPTPPPVSRPEPAREAPQGQRPQPHGDGQHQGPPRTGKALFAWTKDQEQRHGVGLLKYLTGWAKLQDFPGRFVDWDADQVSLAYAEARRKLASYERSDELTEALSH